MRKALILTVMALFGSEALAQKSFRHTPTVALDDIQDNNMMMMKFERPPGSTPPFNPSSRFDDLQDNEMALDLSQRTINRAISDVNRLANNDYRVKVGRWDDAQDNEMNFQGAVNEALKHYGNAHRLGFDDVQDNNLIGTWERPIERPLKYDDLEDNEMFGGRGNFGGNTVLINRPQTRMNLDDAEDNEMFGGRGTIGGPTVLINRPQTRMNLDDFQDDFLLDQYEVFMLLGDGQYQESSWGIPPARPSDTFASENPGFLGSGKSGVLVQGGSAPQGGVYSSGSGQVTGPIGNTGANYIIGGSVSYSPGAPVSITPHVGVSVKFDDEEN